MVAVWLENHWGTKEDYSVSLGWMRRTEGAEVEGAHKDDKEKEGVNLGRQVSSFFSLFFFCRFRTGRRREKEEVGGGVTVAVALFCVLSAA